MNISWLGTASLLVKCKDTTILFDPYLRENSEYSGRFPLDILNQVNAIVITHPHFDHFCDIDVIMAHCNAPVYVCKKGVELAKQQGCNMDRIRELGRDILLTIGNVKIKVYQGCHCEFDKRIVFETLKKVFMPKYKTEVDRIKKLMRMYKIDTNNDVYNYEVMGDDENIFIMGTANLCEDVEYPTRMDLLVYPFQGRSDMVEYSLPFFEKLKPKVIMLDHFEDAFPPVSSTMDCKELIDVMNNEFSDIKIFEPDEQKEYEVGMLRQKGLVG